MFDSASKLLHWLSTVSKAPGLHTCLHSRQQFSPSWSPLQPSVAICSFHELEQLAPKVELLHRSSSCLELTAASPSLPVHQSQSVSSRAQGSSFQTGLSLTFPLRTIEEIELDWTLFSSWSCWSFMCWFCLLRCS